MPSDEQPSDEQPSDEQPSDEQPSDEMTSLDATLEVVMPNLGEEAVEGTIIKWLVVEGESVVSGDPLCEITVDKVDTEIVADTDGVLTEILVSGGLTVSVGSPIAVLTRVSEGSV